MHTSCPNPRQQLHCYNILRLATKKLIKVEMGCVDQAFKLIFDQVLLKYDIRVMILYVFRKYLLYPCRIILHMEISLQLTK